MQTGSGTSLKVGRAMSYGLPVISTNIGARGYDGVITINNTGELLDALANLDWATASKESRAHAEKISWDRAGVKLYGIVRGLSA